MSAQLNNSDTHEPTDFVAQAQQGSTGILYEFWEFLRYNKKWWLTPIVIVLLLVGALVMLAGTAVGPLLYPLF